MSVIGIDLGTTNSLVAAWTGKGPELIPNALGSPLTPSVVGLDDDGTVLVGQAAVERLITHPDLTVADFKRRMGSEQPTRLGRREFRPEELSALVLRSLKADAEQRLGNIEEAIISVPAYFNDAQRKATLNAGQLAGLKVERLINEPTAAALAYGLNEGQGTQFLIFDLGGGTFDVSILDRYETVMEVRATAGDNFLGGNDFRDAVAALICRKSDVDAAKLSPRDRNLLVRGAERVKIDLTRDTEARFEINLESKPLRGSVHRHEFEAEVEGLLRRLRLPLERAINDARLRPADIHNVVLVGGATRMPMVRRLVARLFGKMPLSHLDPDRIVALGAAVQAGLKSRNAALEDVVMTDVSPYTLGIAVRACGGGDELVMSPIIERNAVVPISRSHTYTTVADYQTTVRLNVYQGENLRPHNNTLLGEIDVDVPKAKAGEQPIEVRFTYDINGALEVEAKVVKSGRMVQRVFKNQANLSDAELKKRFAELQDIKLHPREQAENRALIARAERIWAESLGEKRDLVGGLIQDFLARVADQQLRDATELRRQFAETLDDLERPVLPGGP